MNRIHALIPFVTRTMRNVIITLCYTYDMKQDSPNHFERMRAKVSIEITPGIKAKLREFLNVYFKTDPYIRRNLNTVLLNYMLGGKFIRATMCYLSFMMHSNSKVTDEDPISKPLLDLMLGLEFLQLFLLIHDDVMDQDATRRKNDAMHISLKKLIEDLNDGTHNTNCNIFRKGEMLAICLGDMIFSYTFEILAQFSHIPQCIATFSKLVSIVGKGQFNDLLWSSLRDRSSIRKHKVLEMYTQKTSAYTFVLPLILGKLLSDYYASKKIQLEHKGYQILNALGNRMGLIYQITDDEIGTYVETSISGKVQFSDLREHKFTFLLLILLESVKTTHNKGEYDTLHTILMSDQIRDQDIHYVLKKFKEYGIAQKVAVMKQRYLHMSRKDIAMLKIGNEYKDILIHILEFIYQRVS